MALQPKEQLKKNKPFKGVIITEIVPTSDFFPAENYHQRYYKKTLFVTGLTFSAVVVTNASGNFVAMRQALLLMRKRPVLHLMTDNLMHLN